MRRSIWWIALVALLIVAHSSQQLMAQITTASITGLVGDSSGAMVPDATITSRNIATGVEAQTRSSATGNYVIQNLPVGTYELTVTSSGFKTWTRSGLALSTGETARVDVALEVGQASERIEVTAVAPVLRTESTEVSTTMEHKLVEDLPINASGVGGGMRNAVSFFMMMPEVKSSNTQSAGDDFQIGGGQMVEFGINVDGLPIEMGWRTNIQWANIFFPPVDSVQESRTDTGSFKADEGGASGGTMLVVTKSGTNELHGGAFEFYQSQVFDANTWSNNRVGRPKAIYHRNDFGFNVAGPVVIPGIYNGRNKTYFSVTYEGFRYPTTSGASLITVPLAAMHNGDFSGLKNSKGAVIPIYDPSTTRVDATGNTIRDVFPGNLIPSNRISPISKNIVGYYPNPNQAGTQAGNVNNYINPGNMPRKEIQNNLMIKGDQSFGTKNRFTMSWIRNYRDWWTAYDSDPTNPANYNGLPFPLMPNYDYFKYDPEYANIVRISDVHMISPALVNTLTLGYNRFEVPYVDITDNPSANYNWNDKLGGIKNTAAPNTFFPLINYTTDNYASGGGNGANLEANNAYQFDESVSWVKGSHILKFGYNYTMLQYNRVNYKAANGYFNFARLETAIPGDNSGNSGNAFASFLLGQVDSGQLGTGGSTNRRYPSHSFYVQDDWKISRRLTANLGFRGEFYPPAYEQHDRISVFDATLPNAAANGLPGALTYLGNGPGRLGTRTFYDTAKGWGPRAGLAFMVTPKTVFRGGAGIYYTPNRPLIGGWVNSQGFTGMYIWNSPDSGITPAFNWDNGMPAHPIPPSTDPTFATGSTLGWEMAGELSRLPTLATWNAAISRMLPGGFVLDVTYTATKGTHLSSGMVNYMQIDPKYAYLGSLLNKPIDDPAVVALGFKPPFPAFKSLMGPYATLGQSLRMFPQYQQVWTGGKQDWYGTNNRSGNSTYNALMVKATKRYSLGLSLMGTFTWSKLLTDADSGDAWIASNAGAQLSHANYAQDQYNRRLEKSYGVMDQPAAFKITGSYDLPLGKGKKFYNTGLASQVVGNWTFGGYFQAISGYPLGVIDNASLNYLDGGVPLPNVLTSDWRAPVSGNKFDPYKDQFLTASAFQRRTNPAADPIGDAPRLNGNARAMPSITDNISLQRGFRLYKERVTANLRWEVFDLLNHKRWANPGLDLSNPGTFGLVTSASGNRTMQFSLRVGF